MNSNWDFNTIFGIEGENNRYRIYRPLDAEYTELLKTEGNELQESFAMAGNWNIYTIKHMTKSKVEKFKEQSERCNNERWHIEKGAAGISGKRRYGNADR